MTTPSDAHADFIRLQAVPGVQRIVCPYCGGGSSHERSMAVVRNERGQISWRCFRASCGSSGGNREIGAVQRKPPRLFVQPTVALPLQQMEFLRTKYQIRETSTWRLSLNDDRIVVPVKGPGGKLRGVVARAFDGRTPKSLTYVHVTDEPFISWVYPASLRYGLVVIVEDALSAARVAQAGAIGVALLGCYLSLPAAIEIADGAVNKQAVLALDADAFANAIKLTAKHQHLFWPPLRVAKLNKDLKDATEEALEDFLNDHANEREQIAEGNDK